MKINNILGAALTCPPGGGKDATGKYIVKNGILPPISGMPWEFCSVGSDICRKTAAEQGMEIEDFTERRYEDATFLPEFDHEVDTASSEFCNKKMAKDLPFIITSRMVPSLLFQEAPFFAKHKLPMVIDPSRIIRILYTCNLNERITRVVRREFQQEFRCEPTDPQIAMRFEAAKDKTCTRETLDAIRYRNLYGIHDIYNQNYFTVVIPTDGISLEKQVALTAACIKQYMA